MRISHIVENLNRGGLERVVIDLAKAQAAAGHDCQVVCLFEAGSLAHELTSHGIPVVACDKRDGADMRALLRLRRALSSQRTEVLHSHNGLPHYYAMAAAMGLGLRRIVNTRHGMGDVTPSSRREWLCRQSMHFADVAVAVSEACGVLQRSASRKPSAATIWSVAPSERTSTPERNASGRMARARSRLSAIP